MIQLFEEPKSRACFRSNTDQVMQFILLIISETKENLDESGGQRECRLVYIRHATNGIGTCQKRSRAYEHNHWVFANHHLIWCISTKEFAQLKVIAPGNPLPQ